MAKCIGLWYGGSNYSAPNGHDPRDCEQFDSLKAAVRTFEARADFDPFYPCVDRSDGENASQLLVYFGTKYHENGPDRIVQFGKHGGTVIKRG